MKEIKKKEEYCIWCEEFGQCDTSTDWDKLYKIVSSFQKSQRYSSFNKIWIIPTKNVGKGRFRTIKQIQEDTDKIIEESNNALQEARRVLGK